MKTIKLFILFYFIGIYFSVGQELSQTIKGKVVDEATGQPVPYANVVIKNSNPLLGTITDVNGNYRLVKVPIGRYDIEISFLGYEPALLREVLVSSGKEVVMDVTLRESIVALDEVKVKPKVNKELPLNNMATVSARMLSVEEAQRYAGGFDDPARLASSFAGVASNLGDNGIVVRGNAPQMLSWRMEGVEIPNPNHFADLSAFGAGGLTALSSQMLANSDFYTGAFPAEYGNAISGVFDMQMRVGNNSQHEHTFQVGGIGIDFSSEGPFKRGGKSSYLFNYRYSTLALLKPLLPEDAEGTTYQDLAFKLNFPTKNMGTYSLWGMGLLDGSGTEPEKDTADWHYTQDKEKSDASQYMGAVGLTHKIYTGGNTYIRSSLAIAGNGLDYFVDEMDMNQQLQHREKIKNTNWNLVLSSYLNHKFGKQHTNRTGIIATNINYDMMIQQAPELGEPFQTIVESKGNSFLLSAYSSSNIRLSQQVNIVAGLHTQYFTLNSNQTIEPRVGINWDMSHTQTLGAAYGKHSRLERLNIYFARNENRDLINKELDFTYSNHLVFNYSLQITDNTRIKIEPYYQWLTNVPIEQRSYFSTLNIKDNWFINSPLVNKGKGENIGVDLTLERFLSNGYYYLLTASLFNSEYKGGDGLWRNTRYNRQFLVNVLAGKEWQVGKNKQNLLSLNGRVSFQGGDRYIPVDYSLSGSSGSIHYQYNKAFGESLDPSLFVHFTLNYRINKPKHSSTWSFNVINATGVKEFYGFRRNLQTGVIEREMEAIIIPNISYKIEF